MQFLHAWRVPYQYGQFVSPGLSSKCDRGFSKNIRVIELHKVAGEKAIGCFHFPGISRTLCAFVLTHFRTENRFPLYLEMLQTPRNRTRQRRIRFLFPSPEYF